MNKMLKMALLTWAVIMTPVFADELTLLIEQDLARLGYDPGLVDGEETVETTIAIAKYQAEHDLEITGEATQNLIRVLAATTRIRYQLSIRHTVTLVGVHH